MPVSRAGVSCGGRHVRAKLGDFQFLFCSIGVSILVDNDNLFSLAGLIGLALSYALATTSMLSGLLTVFTETEKELVSVERIAEYVDTLEGERRVGVLKVSLLWWWWRFHDLLRQIPVKFSSNWGVIHKARFCGAAKRAIHKILWYRGRKPYRLTSAKPTRKFLWSKEIPCARPH